MQKETDMEAADVKVTIVMPILNTEKYIRECLESLVNQTMQEIEILCVDANSTDGTREILREYTDRDERIRILTDDKGSTGYANNLGMRNARGKYVAIVEPDDFVALDMYEKMYQAAEEYDADLVRADYKVFFGTGDARQYMDKAIAAQKDYGKVLDPSEEQRLFQNDMSTWAGIYRRSFIEENHICHNETPGAAYQDNGFWFLAMVYAKKLVYLPISGYRYRMDNPDSSVHNRRKLYAICDEYTFIRDRLVQEGIFEKYKQTYLWAKFIRYLSAYYRLDDTLKAEFAERFSGEMQWEIRLKEKGNVNARSDNPFLFSPGQQKLLDMLLRAGDVFHRHIMGEKAAFQELVEGDETLILYGCGSDGLRLLNYIRKEGYLDRIECLCDSNQRLWGTELFGKRVYGLEEVKRKWEKACYIVASINYGDEIENLLRNEGSKSVHQMNIL